MLFTMYFHAENKLILGPDNIILPDSVLLKVMHAHTKAEIIADFCVSVNFDNSRGIWRTISMY